MEPETRLRAARFIMYCNRRFVGDLVSRFELVDAGHDVEQIAADEYGNLYFNGELDGTSYGPSADQIVSMLSQVATEVVFNDAEFVSAYLNRDEDKAGRWETNPTGRPRTMASYAGDVPKDWETAVAEAKNGYSIDRKAAYEYVGRLDELSAAPFTTASPVLEGMADQYAYTHDPEIDPRFLPDCAERNLEFDYIMEAIESLNREYSAYLLLRCGDMAGEEFGDKIASSSLDDMKLLKLLEFSEVSGPMR